MNRARHQAKLRRLGMGTARERLTALFDPGTAALGPEDDTLAVVLGQGWVHGWPVRAYASDAYVLDGTIGAREAAAIAGQIDVAVAEGLPVVGLWQSHGARETEHHGAMAGNAGMFRAITRASGAVPHLVGVLGPCFGVAAYAAALADGVVAVRRGAALSTTSPAVIRAATGRATTIEELGGIAMHAGEAGTVHHVADDEAAALAWLRATLGVARGVPTPSRPPAGDPVAAVVPANAHVPYDVHQLISALADAESFLEWHADWGPNMVVGFARLAGAPIALVANQSAVKGGVLDGVASRKAARFIRLADGWGVPLLYLVDVPGILATPEEERAGLLRAGALLYQAVDTEVARLALVVRKCYGGAFVMLQPRQAGGDRVLALPGVAIAVAGAPATFAMRHGREAATHADPAAFRREAIAEITNTPTDAASAVAAGLVDEIVAPEAARDALIAALQAVGPRPRGGSRRPPPRWPV